MNPTHKIRSLAQTILNYRTGAGLKVDGIIGPRTIEAAAKWIRWNFKGVPDKRRWVAAVIQREAAMRGIHAGPADAFHGSQTEDAAHRMLPIYGMASESPAIRPDEALNEITTAASTIRCWSPTTAQFRAHYGMEGGGQAMVSSPYPLRLDWDLSTVTTRFSAHASLVPHIEAAMQDVRKHYGIREIQRLGLDRFGGCLNVRLKRGGSTPSVHSWGAAIDWFPSRNRLKQSRRSALFAKKPYEPFLNIWEKHGFMSLGRCYNFDWMHVQANP